jgi:glycosyltransferase involved in cell wall biosynthesis
LKIANIIHHLTRGGGVVVQALNLAKAIQDLQHEISLITMTTEVQDPTSQSLAEGLPIKYVKSHISGLLSPFLLSRGLTETILEGQHEIIQAFDPLIAGLAAMLTKQTISNIPIVVRLGTTYVDFFRSKYVTPDSLRLVDFFRSAVKLCSLLPAISILEKYTLNYADVIVPNCEYLASIYASKISNPQKIKVIRNGVDSRRFSPEGPKYPLHGNHLWILYIGRIEHRKGLHLLLKAMPKVFQHSPNTRLLIVGRSPIPAYLNSLKKLATTLGIMSKIEFLGPVSSDDAANLMRSTNILVFPSTTGHIQVEGLPNTILEGMSSGLPIVATEICGVPEVIINEVTGILIKPNSIEQLSSALCRLLDSPALRVELKTQSREYILKNNTISVAAKEYISLYRTILNRRAD